MSTKTKAQLEAELKGLDEESLAIGRIAKVLRESNEISRTLWRGDEIVPTQPAVRSVARILTTIGARYGLRVKVERKAAGELS